MVDLFEKGKGISWSKALSAIRKRKGWGCFLNEWLSASIILNEWLSASMRRGWGAEERRGIFSYCRGFWEANEKHIYLTI